MKKSSLVLAILLIVSISFSQTPNAFKYQTIVRDGSGQALVSQSVAFQISILQTSSSGTTVYSEEHYCTTNQFGLVNFEIGSGTWLFGDFSTIDWSSDLYFVQIYVDIYDGNGFQDMGASQLLSVPYALNAKTAENTFSGDYSDLTNQPAIPTNTSDLTNDSGFIISPDDADADATNELQNLSLNTTTLNITGGTGVDLSVLQDGTGTDSQSLSVSSGNLNISNGTGVTLEDINYWSLSGTTVSYNGGQIVAEGNMHANDYTTVSGISALYEISPFNAKSDDPDDIKFYSTTSGIEARASTTGTSKDIYIPIDIPKELMGTQQKIGDIIVNYKVDNSSDYIDYTAVVSVSGGAVTTLLQNTTNYSSTTWASYTLSPNKTFTGSVYLLIRCAYTGTGSTRDIILGNISVSLLQN